MFIAANFEEVTGQEDNPDKALIRFEFIELLIRIANEKYKKTNICPDLAMSFQYLIDTHIQPVNCIDEFSTWRRETLYTNEVNDILYANEQNLKKVYDTGIKFKAQKRLHRKECIEIFTVEADVDLGEREATVVLNKRTT